MSLDGNILLEIIKPKENGKALLILLFFLDSLSLIFYTLKIFEEK